MSHAPDPPAPSRQQNSAEVPRSNMYFRGMVIARAVQRQERQLSPTSPGEAAVFSLRPRQRRFTHDGPRCASARVASSTSKGRARVQLVRRGFPWPRETFLSSQRGAAFSARGHHPVMRASEPSVSMVTSRGNARPGRSRRLGNIEYAFPCPGCARCSGCSCGPNYGDVLWQEPGWATAPAGGRKVGLGRRRFVFISARASSSPNSTALVRCWQTWTIPVTHVAGRGLLDNHHAAELLLVPPARRRSAGPGFDAGLAVPRLPGD